MQEIIRRTEGKNTLHAGTECNRGLNRTGNICRR